jgi:hypothetical protein
MGVCMCVYVCMYGCMCVCVCVCMYVCIRLCCVPEQLRYRGRRSIYVCNFSNEWAARCLNNSDLNTHISFHVHVKAK